MAELSRFLWRGGVTSYTISGRLSIRSNAFSDNMSARMRTERERERERERPTDVESRWIAYACKYKEELDGTGERRRSH